MIDNRLLNYLNRRWYNISKFTDRRDLVGWILDYMKKYNISDRYKEQIYNVVLKLPKKTDLQKERFIRYYGLQPTEFKKETLSAISREENCTPNAVRNSVISIRIAMFRIHDEDFSILEKIYEEYYK
ncbi:MAG TPA: hypothetical protein IAD08_08355 [Candidatus Scatovivens faecipullorum]|nr:hypothetical protein [Candidatus Scatovivens faecipullorum]